jgi:beta-lactamase regulating signal transducer with metallopeptidase domain
MSEKPLIDIESKIREIFDVNAKAFSQQRQPLKVRETVMDEATEKQQERMKKVI